MQQLGGLPLVLFVVWTGRGRESTAAREARTDRTTASGDAVACERPPIVLPVAIVVFFDDVSEDEAVAVARDGAHEHRFARVVAKHPPDRANRLAQRAVGDDDVAPDAFEDLASVDGFAPPLDEEDEQVEIARNERQLASVADEDAAARATG